MNAHFQNGAAERAIPTSLNAEENNCCMPWLDGQRQWASCYDHMHCILQCSFTTQYPLYRMVFHNWNYSQALM